MLAGLLVWNIWLTVRLFNYTTIGNDNRTVIQNTVNGYETDVTKTVSETKSSIVRVIQGARKNSGVIFAAEKDDAYIMTSSQGIQNNSSALVVFDNGVSVNAMVMGVDNGTGLAFIKCQPDFAVTAIKQGDSSLITPGETVTALGGSRDNESAMISTGVLSSPAQQTVSPDSSWLCGLLETDAVVNDDNIGGALLNASNELLGIIIAKPTEGQLDMGYAVDINEIRNVFNEIKYNGTVTRGNLGVVVRGVSTMTTYEKNAQNIALDQTYGVLVMNVQADSAADGRLSSGDLIKEIDGKHISTSQDLHTILYTHSKGDAVTLSVDHDGETRQITVDLR